jgi:replication initiator protein RepSA
VSEPATIATPTEMGELDPGLLAGIVQRASAPGFDRFRSQLRSSGYCARPVRLRGEVCDQRRQRVWSTDGEPDGVLRKACGNRREAVCPSCAERYRQDAYHLIGAGMRGGKGVPDSVSAHPFVFATLTAPSFGHVHTRPLDRHGNPARCRPRRDTPVCSHGVRLSCGQVHDEDDPCLGQPMCLECFDHTAAVIWNNTLGELWRRTTVYLPRHLAAVLGITQKRLRQLARIAYVKVAEYQARGLVHLHVVIRVDRAMPDYRKDEIRPPDPRFTSGLLEHAVNGAIEAVSAPIAEDLTGDLGEQRVRWGQERHVRAVEEPGQLAGYLAKYSTKSTEQASGLLHPIDSESVDTAPVSEHIRGYLRAAFTLHDLARRASEERRATEREEYRHEHANQDMSAAITTRRDGPANLAWRAKQAQAHDETIRIRLLDGTEHTGRIGRITTTEPGPEAPEETLVLALAGGPDVRLAEIEVIAPPPPPEPKAPGNRGDPRLAANAHNLGYRGHCLTKSRRWSTTFMALRQAREQHVQEQLLNRSGVPESQRQLAEFAADERVSRFEFVGVGHLTAADAFLAAQAAARAREYRQLAREELADRVA